MCRLVLILKARLFTLNQMSGKCHSTRAERGLSKAISMIFGYRWRGGVRVQISTCGISSLAVSEAGLGQPSASVLAIPEAIDVTD